MDNLMDISHFSIPSVRVYLKGANDNQCIVAFSVFKDSEYHMDEIAESDYERKLSMSFSNYPQLFDALESFENDKVKYHALEHTPYNDDISFVYANSTFLFHLKDMDNDEVIKFVKQILGVLMFIEDKDFEELR